MFIASIVYKEPIVVQFLSIHVLCSWQDARPVDAAKKRQVHMSHIIHLLACSKAGLHEFFFSSVYFPMISGRYLSTQIRQKNVPINPPATFANAFGEKVSLIIACHASSGSSATSIESNVEYTTGRLSIPLLVFCAASNNGAVNARVSPPSH